MHAFDPVTWTCRFARHLLAALALVVLAAASGATADDLDYTITRVFPAEGTRDWCFMQCRGAAVPGNPPRVLITAQQTFRTTTHDYRDQFQIETRDLGETWSQPVRIEPLRRARAADGFEIVIGDFTPQWHAKTQTVLGTGLTFDFANGKTQYRPRVRVAYSVYDPKRNEWNGLNFLDLPERDHAGSSIKEPGSGCCQWCEKADGDVLLPLRYRRAEDKTAFTSIVALCAYDGRTLRYKEHGTELSLDKNRGLVEPSIARFGGRYFLTLRNDDGGWVARGTDGIHFDPIRPWTFDDGKPLGSYNTQQHWVAHGDGLFLVHTRKGANNDHIMRHRAPLFIARVDPERLCVVRASERVLIPEEGACLGNFGVTDVGPRETWVVVGENVIEGSPRFKQGPPPRVIVARIRWSSPNREFSSGG
ncbi:MAG: exo-alpha-sialidase [Pirellulales bacterium]|nr:exo-alpha-sialidase [Pirellulales bacterium]